MNKNLAAFFKAGALDDTLAAVARNIKVTGITHNKKSGLTVFTCTMKNGMPEEETTEALRSALCAELGLEAGSTELDISAEIDFDGMINSKPIDKPGYIALKEDLHRRKIEEDVKQNGSTGRKKDLEADESIVLIGSNFKLKKLKMSEIDPESGIVTLAGEIMLLEKRELRGDKTLYSFDVTDFTGSVTVKYFCNRSDEESVDKKITEGIRVKLRGEVVYDRYSKGIVIMLRDLVQLAVEKKTDDAPVKRVELHLHTQMSAMDAITPVDKFVKRAAEWGHKALAVTDHGVVQAFPEAYLAAAKAGVKIIYGIEAYIFDDVPMIVTGQKGQDFDGDFVVFDVETTGLDCRREEIIELGAVKVRGGKIIDTFGTFVDPRIEIPANITKITGIKQDDVHGKPPIEQVLPEFLRFAGDAVLVAHNAEFDMGFVRAAAKKCGAEVTNTVLDTLNLSRFVLPDLKNHKLDTIAEHFNIDPGSHHRASDDAKTTASAMLELFGSLRMVHGISDLEQISTGITNVQGYRSDTYHAIILVRTKAGLKNLYKLVSMAHIEYFYKKPRIPKSVFDKHREGLMLGTACEQGELFGALLAKKDRSEIAKLTDYYDYFEIQPAGNNMHLIDSGKVSGEDEIRDIYREIVRLGEATGKPVVAASDVHFMDARDEIFRRILMEGQGFTDADRQPPLYLRTTDEMLAEFAYLGEAKAYETVVTNTNLIADMIEDGIRPIPPDTYTPKIDGAEEFISDLAHDTAKSMYGDPLPEIVQKRLDKELNSIIKNGFAVMYYIAHKLVKKSLEDGYIVGSRGSVGSSLTATMCGISEVNPLPPHYYCPACKHSEFVTDGSVGSGYDMPEKICPSCGAPLNQEGQDIPYETFLGFNGEKAPDIDLNFSGEYQSTAHKNAEEIFGAGYTFRAGTISGVADKTAYGFVMKYLESKGIVATDAEINRLTRGCTGVKRTTGQHPGGVIVVPHGSEIYDFTPVQHPADKAAADVVTTHFAFEFLHDTLLKLDLLGHDVPTMIRMLEILSGVPVSKVKVPDKNVMELFQSPEPLGVTAEQIDCPLGVNGLPEVGTEYVKQMLVETRPGTVTDLIQISGLSHGTDVWLGNAKDLIAQNICTISEVIGTRDSIMVYLMYKGLEPVTSFKIMEDVRKGKGVKPEYEQAMTACNVPQWYIDSCKKIKYMFPKAHAAAYIISALRIGWYKVYCPEAFYATYFTVRGDDFDAELMCSGIDVIKDKLAEFKKRGRKELSTKEESICTLLEIIVEMYARKIEFLPIDLYESDSTKFKVAAGGIRPPFKALKGLGGTAAEGIIEARKTGQFKTVEDLVSRTRISKTVVEMLTKNGCLGGIPESRQVSLF